jgi:hypothetical protein
MNCLSWAMPREMRERTVPSPESEIPGPENQIPTPENAFPGYDVRLVSGRNAAITNASSPDATKTTTASQRVAGT